MTATNTHAHPIHQCDGSAIPHRAADCAPERCGREPITAADLAAATLWVNEQIADALDMASIHPGRYSAANAVCSAIARNIADGLIDNDWQPSPDRIARYLAARDAMDAAAAALWPSP